jgi:16S rRNA (cytidine1402-2'-O)-methyltransferase
VPLYIVSTPIGNQKDLSLRAIEILSSSDYILCEDTRHSAPLLALHLIKAPLKAYHKFNEAKTEEQLLHDLTEGLNISLISDAGSPGIADPSSRLVNLCHRNQIPVSVIPGACAAIAALQLSGWEIEQFQFVSFLPRSYTQLAQALHSYLAYPGITVAYESPHRILKTLQLLATSAPSIHVGIGRELTKHFEEWLEGSPKEIHDELDSRSAIRGEFVLLLKPTPKDPTSSPQNNNPLTEPAAQLSAEEEVLLLIERDGLSLTDACKRIASARSLSKKTLYKSVIQKQQPS